MLLINFFKKASGSLYCLQNNTDAFFCSLSQLIDTTAFLKFFFLKLPLLRDSFTVNVSKNWYLHTANNQHKMKNYITTTFLVLCFFCSFSQSSRVNTDSLLAAARAAKDDSTKISKLNKIAFYAIFNNTDLALKTIKECEDFAIESNNPYGLAIITNTHGIYMDVTGQSDSAKYYFNKALDISTKNNFIKVKSNATNNLGMYHWNTSQYNKALDYFFESLKIDESINNRKSMGSSFNNIGLIYQEMNLYEKALEYHNKSLEIRKEFNLKKDQVASYNNLGICYRSMGQVDKSIASYKKGIELSKEINNLLDYYKLLDNLGNAYQDKGDYYKAIESYKASLDRPENFQADEKSVMVTYSNMTSAYNHIDKPELALNYANKGFEILNNSPQFRSYANDLYLHSAESNFMINNIAKARTLIKEFVKIKDSTFSQENAKAIADLEVKYDTEKKEKEILIQRAEIAEQDLKLQKRLYQIFGLIGFAVLLSLLGYLFYNQQKLKNVQLIREKELYEALAKIETQNRLQEQRLRISRDLHDNIGAQLTFIISSIDNLKYGFKLPEKVEQKLEGISSFTGETINELRDTIWAMNKSEITFEDLQSRISNFIDKANASSDGIQFSFDVDETINTNTTFTAIEGMNMYRIIQEALNNSIKHADASLLRVHVSQTDKKLIIEVSDNGKGYDLKNVTEGNGINNMKKRAVDTDGELLIFSDNTNGTKVRLTKPLNT